MLLSEALLESKANGKAYVRESGLWHGWIRWVADWTYKFDGENLIADDWILFEPDAEAE